MKASILSLAAVAGLVSAQFSGVPECAQACLTSAISSVGCEMTNVACQCSSTAEIQGFGAGCIIGACTAAGDLQSAISGGQGLCSSYLATVSASTAPSSAEATTTVTETSASATETSTVTAETTTIIAPTMNSTTMASGTGVMPTSPTGPTQVPIGAAPTLAAGVGGLVGLAAAFVAAAL